MPEILRRYTLRVLTLATVVVVAGTALTAITATGGRTVGSSVNHTPDAGSLGSDRNLRDSIGTIEAEAIRGDGVDGAIGGAVDRRDGNAHSAGSVSAGGGVTVEHGGGAHGDGLAAGHNAAASTAGTNASDNATSTNADATATGYADSNCLGPDVRAATPLAWLRRHQDDDGWWRARDYRLDDGILTSDEQGEMYPRDFGLSDPFRGDPSYDIVATAMAVYAHLSWGYSHQDNEFANTVKLALRALIRVQKEQTDVFVGAFYDASSIDPLRDHAAALLAIAEDYGLTASTVLHKYAVAGLNHLGRLLDQAINRFDATGASDVSQEAVAFALLALNACRLCDIGDPDLTDAVVRLANASPDCGPIVLLVNSVANRTGRPPPESVDALLDAYPPESVTSGRICAASWLLLRGATLGDRNGAYADMLRDALEPKMVRDPSPFVAGSWEPMGPERAGGRCYATALYASIAYCYAWTGRGAFPRH